MSSEGEIGQRPQGDEVLCGCLCEDIEARSVQDYSLYRPTVRNGVILSGRRTLRTLVVQTSPHRRKHWPLAAARVGRNSRGPTPGPTWVQLRLAFVDPSRQTAEIVDTRHAYQRLSQTLAAVLAVPPDGYLRPSGDRGPGSSPDDAERRGPTVELGCRRTIPFSLVSQHQAFGSCVSIAVVFP